MKRYSLANYTLSITPSASVKAQGFSTITIGGTDQYVGSISVGVEQSIWSTSGFATGAWVHNKSLDRTGTISVTVSQLADQVLYFIRLANIYLSGADYAGCELSISDNSGNLVASGTDCYPTNIPSISYGSEAGTLTLTWTCGRVTYNS